MRTVPDGHHRCIEVPGNRLGLAFGVLAFAMLADAACAQAAAAGPFTEFEAVAALKSSSQRWKQADEGTTEANAKLEQAQSARLPKLNLGVREFVGRVNQIQYGFGDPGTLSVFTFGATTVGFLYEAWDPAALRRIDAAEQNADASASTLQSVRGDLIFYVLALYAQIQRWESMSFHRSQNVENISQLRALAERKVKSDYGIQLDVRRAEARLALGKMKLLEAQSNAIKARADLASLLGLPSLDQPVNPIEHEITLPFDPEKLDQDAVVQARPEVAAALKISEAAQSLVGTAERERWPKIILAGEAGIAGVTAFDGITHGLVGTLGVSVSMPLYTGGLISGQIAAARSTAVRADAEHDRILGESGNQLHSTIYLYRSAHEALATARAGAAVAQEEVDLAKRRFSFGAGGNFEVITAEMSLAQIQDDLTDAWFAHLQTSYQLLRQANRLPQYVESLEKR